MVKISFWAQKHKLQFTLLLLEHSEAVEEITGEKGLSMLLVTALFKPALPQKL